jgi:hypothetical protein
VLITRKSRTGRGSSLKPDTLIRYLGLCAAVLGFAGGIFVFVKVQILQAYPFYDGVFGNVPFFLGVTYTVALEIFAVIAASGVFLCFYSRAAGRRRAKLERAVGGTSLVFGILVAGVGYVETRLLWGEILPGIHVWGGLTGGGGYPWGTEQVAYNTCFVPSLVRGDCEFLNYNELLLIALLCAMVGFVLWHGVSEESIARPGKLESFAFLPYFWMLLSHVEVGGPIAMRNSDPWNSPNAHNTQTDRAR